jgi:hypothetical protein
MKPLTAAFICALVVALAVVGYLYYQRTSNVTFLRFSGHWIKRLGALPVRV